MGLRGFGEAIEIDSKSRAPFIRGRDRYNVTVEPPSKIASQIKTVSLRPRVMVLAHTPRAETKNRVEVLFP